jgi:hypothetical protein
MKLKEYPASLLTSHRLSRLPYDALHRRSGTALPLIVSLTSIPSRLGRLHLTIRSLLARHQQADKVVLWLNDALRGTLPDSLAQLEGPLFEIRFAGLTSSHRKLVHALDAFPGATIVTCDDDVMYDATWLARLHHDHRRYPDAVIAHQCRRISYDAAGAVLPYRDWPTETRVDVTSPDLMPVGYGGVLYPPDCLFGDVRDAELFLKLAPAADDIWFKAMSLLRGTSVRRSSQPGDKPLPVIGSQTISLRKTNIGLDRNREQWDAVSSHYAIPRVDRTSAARPFTE